MFFTDPKGEPMNDYKIRTVEEKRELDEKIVKLTGFIFSENFPDVNPDEQIRLRRQLQIMMEYSRCLQERIDQFY
jgi:hypothetical protein